MAHVTEIIEKNVDNCEDPSEKLIVSQKVVRTLHIAKGADGDIVVSVNDEGKISAKSLTVCFVPMDISVKKRESFFKISKDYISGVIVYPSLLTVVELVFLAVMLYVCFKVVSAISSYNIIEG